MEGSGVVRRFHRRCSGHLSLAAGGCLLDRRGDRACWWVQWLQKQEGQRDPKAKGIFPADVRFASLAAFAAFLITVTNTCQKSIKE